MITAEGAHEIAVSFTRAPARITARVRDNAVRVGLGLVAHIKSTHLSGGSLKTRTGHARRSIFSRVTPQGQDLVVHVGADLRKAKYMRIHELGGVITPKRSQNLTIPIGEAMTAKGVARFSARQVISAPGSFGYTGTFIANDVIFGKRGTGGDAEIVPLFALKKRVVIRAVGYLRKTLVEKKAWISRTMGAGIEQEATRE